MPFARTRQPTFSLFSLDAFYVLPPFSLSRIQLFDNTETHDLFGTMKSKPGVNSLEDAKRSESSQGRSHKGTNPLAKWSSRSKAKKEETEEEDSDDEDEPSSESEADDEPRTESGSSDELTDDVEKTGKGIAKQIRDRMIEPYQKVKGLVALHFRGGKFTDAGLEYFRDLKEYEIPKASVLRKVKIELAAAHSHGTRTPQTFRRINYMIKKITIAMDQLAEKAKDESEKETEDAGDGAVWDLPSSDESETPLKPRRGKPFKVPGVHVHKSAPTPGKLPRIDKTKKTQELDLGAVTEPIFDDKGRIVKWPADDPLGKAWEVDQWNPIELGMTLLEAREIEWNYKDAGYMTPKLQRSFQRLRWKILGFPTDLKRTASTSTAASAPPFKKSSGHKKKESK